jgi:hypothetical protein
MPVELFQEHARSFGFDLDDEHQGLGESEVRRTSAMRSWLFLTAFCTIEHDGHRVLAKHVSSVG